MAVWGECFPVSATVALTVLLLKVTAGGEETCGCWGSNQVYLQYKAPATGWYTSLSDKYIYERNLTIFNDEIQYLLEYKSRSKYWALFERRVKGINHHRGETLLLTNRRVKKIIISCPTRCSCRNIFVQGTACWVINGNYTRSDIKKEQNSLTSSWSSFFMNKNLDLLEKEIKFDSNVSETNITHHKLTNRSSSTNKVKSMSIIEKSNCLLAKLGKCIDNIDNVNSMFSDVQEENSGENDGCQQYASVLANDIQKDSGMKTDYTTHSPAEYIMEGWKKYILTQAEGGNFWWIVAKNEVYAVSDEAGPCPDQLPNSKWTTVDDSEISVTCIKRDTPEGD